MVIINPDDRTNTLEVSGYEGVYRENRRFENSLMGLSRDSSFNFYRWGSNHSYTKGESVFYEDNCHNNLIISIYKINRLQNVRNAFILANESGIEIFTIFDIADVISRGSEILSGEINYNPPERVLSRENLPEINLEKLHKELKIRYGINASDIILLNIGRSKNGIYLVNKGNSKFVLKYRGEIKRDQNYFPKYWMQYLIISQEFM